jgi:vacuole morphology and inheritance protein 14
MKALWMPTDSKTGGTNKNAAVLFATLYKSWCHNAVSTLTMCLLSQSYEHASNLLQIFGTELEITVQFLVQVYEYCDNI